jgi:uncharacterized protein (TIGR00297 family)
VSFLSLVAIGLALNAAAAVLALWRGSVDAGGAAAGVVVGALIFACGGPLFWLILTAFFLSSTAIGYIRRRDKEWLKAVHEKGSRRDAIQVLANGGAGMLAALLYRLTTNPAWAAGFAVSFASSTADTWASELGVLSRSAPVSLFTLRPVPRGVSGGVSPLGTFMSFVGALFIAALFAAFNTFLHALPTGFMETAAVVTLAGFAGSLIDSLLGATLQAQYSAERSGGQGAGETPALTERRRSPEGLPNRLVRGLSFVNNDVVNAASCAAVTLAAVLLAPVLF